MSRQAGLTQLHVAAGILRDSRGYILIAERIDDGPFRGLWEFPGGKIAAGEAAEAALVRELIEEIGVEVRHSEHFLSLNHEYPDRRVSIEFFVVSDWAGEPTALEGQGLKWVRPDELVAAELLPADLPVIEALLADT